MDFEDIKLFSDVFVSWEGEPPFQGRRTAFIRFAGCDVGCKFCDEKSSWSPSKAKYTFKEVLEFLTKESFSLLALTGGEPLQSPYLPNVVKSLKLAYHYIDLEILTSGHFGISFTNHEYLLDSSNLEGVTLVLSPKLYESKDFPFYSYDFWFNYLSYIKERKSGLVLKFLGSQRIIRHFEPFIKKAYICGVPIYLQAITEGNRIKELDLDEFSEALELLNSFIPIEAINVSMQQHPFLYLK